MERCPRCGEMTTQANLYTGQLVCYSRRCGYEEPAKKKKAPRIQDEGIVWCNKRSSPKG